MQEHTDDRPSIELRRGADRLESHADGIVSRHSFAFGPHYDPMNTRFGALVTHNDDVLARTFARIALVDAFQLGRSTIAYQLGYTRLSQLDFAKVTLGSLHAHGKKGALLTVTPSTLGARILRLLEVAGLSHKVTITLTLTEEIHGHTHRSTRRIRVI